MTKDVITNKKTLQEIKVFIEVLKKNRVNINQIILFGSVAKGKQNKYSDIDLAVISSRFGKDPMGEMMFLSKLAWSASDRIEAIPLSSEDMKLKYHPLIGEIKKYGKVVYES